jgi:hypothetical protein
MGDDEHPLAVPSLPVSEREKKGSGELTFSDPDEVSP